MEKKRSGQQRWLRRTDRVSVGYILQPVHLVFSSHGKCSKCEVFEKKWIGPSLEEIEVCVLPDPGEHWSCCRADGSSASTQRDNKEPNPQPATLRSLRSFRWIDVGPRGRDTGWSQVSQGQTPLTNGITTHRAALSPPPNIWLVLSLWLWARPTLTPSPHTNDCFTPHRFGWWRHKPAETAVFSLSPF